MKISEQSSEPSERTIRTKRAESFVVFVADLYSLSFHFPCISFIRCADYPISSVFSNDLLTTFCRVECKYCAVYKLPFAKLSSFASCPFLFVFFFFAICEIDPNSHSVIWSIISRFCMAYIHESVFDRVWYTKCIRQYQISL